MLQEGSSREQERRERPRRDDAPLSWRDIVRRRDREALPFLRYFEHLETTDPRSATEPTGG